MDGDGEREERDGGKESGGKGNEGGWRGREGNTHHTYNYIWDCVSLSSPRPCCSSAQAAAWSAQDWEIVCPTTGERGREEDS